MSNTYDLTLPNKRFNQVVSYMGGLVAFDYTTSDYTDFDAMRLDYQQRGRIKVNVNNSDRTMFGSPAPNWYFRAWHDMCHLLADAPFTPAGEYKAEELMIAQLDALPDLTAEEKELFSLFIHCEVSGQVDYYQRHNAFPENQLAFTLAYLQANNGSISNPALVAEYPRNAVINPVA